MLSQNFHWVTCDDTGNHNVGAGGREQGEGAYNTFGPATNLVPRDFSLAWGRGGEREESRKLWSLAKPQT